MNSDESFLSAKKTELSNNKFSLTTKVKLLGKMESNLANTSTIAGMSMPDFRKFIQFLNNRIVTSILVYISCSAGGQNFIDPYKEITSGNILDLKFTVVTTSSTEAIVSLYSKLTQDTPGVIIKKAIDKGSYSAFFNAMHAPKDPVEKIVSLLIQVPHNASGAITNFSTLPSIRTPHSSWVTVPTDNKNMFVLTKVKTIAQGNRPLTIKDKQVLFIVPQEIAFELSLPSTQFPAIISQQAGSAYHYFAKINTQASFADVAKGFFPVEMTSSKLFYIKELVCANGTYTDVLFFVNTPLQEAEGIVISEGGSSIQVSSQEILLNNGAIYTDNKRQTMELIGNTEVNVGKLVKSYKAESRPDTQTIKTAIFKYFGMPTSPTNTLVKQNEALTAILGKRTNVSNPTKRPAKGTSTKPITPTKGTGTNARVVRRTTINANSSTTAKTDPKIISLLAESLQTLAHYNHKK